MGVNDRDWVRQAERADVPRILEMIRGLAAHEGRPELAVCTEAAIAGALFGEPARAEAVVLMAEDAVVGYGWFYVLVPTFLGRPVMHLEDLYMEPGARGRGLGRRFMGWLAAEAVSRGCVGVEWHVQEDNPRAIEFYEALGARRRSGALTYRLSDAALMAVAESAGASRGERGTAQERRA